MKKKSFILYCDYKEHINLLTQSQKGDLLDALFKHVDGDEVVLEPVVAMAFSFVKSQLDRDNDKYEDVRKRRVEAGKLGGLAKASNAKQNLANASKPKQPVTNLPDTVTDTVTGTGNDTSKKKSKTKVLPKKGERFNFEKHVNDVWAEEAARIKPQFTKQDIQEQMSIFTDYWNGIAGAKGVKLDWIATWRNWIRRADVRKVRTTGKPSQIDVCKQLMEEGF